MDVAVGQVNANRSGLAGAVWVTMGCFGFQRVIRTFGVERRLAPVGEHSGMREPLGLSFSEDRDFLPGGEERQGATHG